jgi:hypothetical protein
MYGRKTRNLRLKIGAADTVSTYVSGMQAAARQTWGSAFCGGRHEQVRTTRNPIFASRFNQSGQGRVVRRAKALIVETCCVLR